MDKLQEIIAGTYASEPQVQDVLEIATYVARNTIHGGADNDVWSAQGLVADNSQLRLEKFRAGETVECHQRYVSDLMVRLFEPYENVLIRRGEFVNAGNPGDYAAIFNEFYIEGETRMPVFVDADFGVTITHPDGRNLDALGAHMGFTTFPAGDRHLPSINRILPAEDKRVADSYAQFEPMIKDDQKLLEWYHHLGSGALIFDEHAYAHSGEHNHEKIREVIVGSKRDSTEFMDVWDFAEMFYPMRFRKK